MKHPKQNPPSMESPPRTLLSSETAEEMLDLEHLQLVDVHRQAMELGQQVRDTRAQFSGEVPVAPSLEAVKARLRQPGRASGKGKRQAPDSKGMDVSWLSNFLNPFALAGTAFAVMLVWFGTFYLSNTQPFLNQNNSNHLSKHGEVKHSPSRRVAKAKKGGDERLDDYLHVWEQTAKQLVANVDSRALEEEAIALGRDIDQQQRDTLSMYHEPVSMGGGLDMAPISQKLPPSLQGLESLTNEDDSSTGSLPFALSREM